ncbi:MAG TPA: 50S ribosomal protein L31e [Candidatus Lokiarchaeia archaeon]|nr:50S ribosomal protein L31e [Candidatus Lokiarchaeia archaeon]
MAKKKVIEKKPAEGSEEESKAEKSKKAKAAKGKTPKAEKVKKEKGEKKAAEAPKEKPAKKGAKKATKKAAKKAAKKAGKKVAKKEVEETRAEAAEALEVPVVEAVVPEADLLVPEAESEVTETFDEETQLERDFRTAEVGAEAEADIILDRVYVVPLRKAQAAPRTERAKHAMKLLQRFVVRHMKPEGLIIAQTVNERIWEHGIYKPPRRIRIRATKNTEGQVNVTLAE